MPIEEITLSVPTGLGETERRGPRPVRNSSDELKAASADITKLIAAYAKSARARDRFAFTKKGRRRNREQYGQSLKAIVKKVAADSSSPVKERATRMQVRTQVYAYVMQLANEMSKDQLKMIRWARTRLRVSLAAAIVGLLGIVFTLTINDIISWPLSGW